MFEKLIKDPARLVANGRLLLQDLERCDLFRHASAMSYVTVFSIIPSLAAVMALLSSFAPLISQQYDVVQVFNRLFSQLTPAAIGDIIEFIKNMLKAIDFKALGASGIIVLFFSLAFLLRQVEIAFNRIWLVRHNRSLIKRFLYFWTFSTLSLFFLSLGLAVFANMRLDSMLMDTADRIQSTFSFTAVIANWFLCFCVFVALYKIIPNCPVRFIDACMGGLLATVCFQIITKGYGIFITKVADYRALYGTLAALPTFLLWLYLSWLIIMVGAVFAWRWQQGFPQENSKKEEDVVRRDPSDPEFFRQRIWTSFMSVLMVYESFERGQSAISAKEISRALCVPPELVFDQIEMLMRMGLIATATESHRDDLGAMEKKLLPTQPANKLSIQQLIAVLCGKITPEDAADESAKQIIALVISKLSNKNYFDLRSVYLSDVVDLSAG